MFSVQNATINNAYDYVINFQLSILSGVILDSLYLIQ